MSRSQPTILLLRGDFFPAASPFGSPAPRACSHFWGGWRCAGKSGQTRRSPKAVAAPQVRTTTKVWPDFPRNPKGRGPFFPISASLVAKIRPVSVTPHSLIWPKWPPVAATPEVGTGPKLRSILLAKRRRPNLPSQNPAFPSRSPSHAVAHRRNHHAGPRISA